MSFVVVLAWLLTSFIANAGVVAVQDNQLHIDGHAQPQLFGAEVQYFRLRGGTGKNVPREKVIALWNKALDRMVEMHANAISFYIPWDFHEYAPGKFDFDGTVDEDGDGHPDYPSRDLKTWFQLIEAHGIHHILVRPGPYINAEWGFLGFGAVPLWFHEKYPESHMRNSRGQRTALYGYDDADFLRESQAWLTAVYQQVLVHHIGPGRPIDFLQLDNETNFQWQSLYAADYSPHAVANYQAFLQHEYGAISALNAHHGRKWGSWTDVRPPVTPGLNIPEDQDWYRFQDETIHVYLQKIRGVWEGLGVREPQVMFTLAESYNVSGHGLLPNYLNRNDPGRTGLMTVNLYPKTYGGDALPLLNNPFKADHDVKAASQANQHYYGNSSQWTMGPEIQGGWWQDTNVTLAARQQTFLTTIGHGLKGLFVYYFNQGDNWDYDWVRNQMLPYYKTLKASAPYNALPADKLPDAFWTKLDDIVANNLLAGWSTRYILQNGGTQKPVLYFDAALDENAEPRAPFYELKNIGEKIVAPYGDWLGGAVELTDPVCFVKDDRTNVPTPKITLDSASMNSEWASGLIGYSLQAGVNPRILPWNVTPRPDYDSCRLLFYQDNSVNSEDVLEMLRARLAGGSTIMTFVGVSVAKSLLAGSHDCQALPELFHGYDCRVGRGHVIQVSRPIYKDFNSDAYADLKDVPARLEVLNRAMNELQLKAHFHLVGGGDRIASFARQNGARYWITVKSSRNESYNGHVLWSDANPVYNYAVTDAMTGQRKSYRGSDLLKTGFSVNLGANGSTSFALEPEKSH